LDGWAPRDLRPVRSGPQPVPGTHAHPVRWGRPQGGVMTTQLTGPSTTPAPAKAPRLGLPQSTSLVMGSIIGVGIFSLPYAIASYGPISLVAMALATVGAVALAAMFAVMSRRMPAA